MRKLLIPFLTLWLLGCGGSAPTEVAKEDEGPGEDTTKEEPPGRGKPVSYWTATLCDANPQLSREAMGELIRMGPSVVGAVIELLKDPEEVNRTRAQTTLARIGKPAAAPLAAVLADEKTGEAAANVLGKIGADAVPALKEALQQSDSMVRQRACMALREIGEPARETAGTLNKLLQDQDAKVRRHAAAALATTGADESAIPNLTAALKDQTDGELRGHAARALAKIGPKAQPAVPALVGILTRDQNEEARAGAAAALGQIVDGESIPAGVGPAVQAALRDASASVRQEAATALGTWKLKTAANGLAAALRTEKEPAARQQMAWALGQLGESAAPAIPALAELLKDKDSTARSSGLEALEKIGAAAAPALAKQLRSPYEDVRKGAVDALKRNAATGVPDDVVPTLIDSLQSEDANVRAGVIEVLGRSGAAAKAAIPALSNALTDSSITVRVKAAETLVKIGAPAASALAKALRSDSDEVRSLAAHGLGVVGGEAARTAAPALAELVANQKANMETRRNAAYALARAGPGITVAPQPLVDALQEKDNDLRRHISAALANIGAPAVEPLVAILKDLNPFVRQYTREALAKIGKPAVPALTEALKNATTTPVRSAAIAALGEIGPAAKEAVPLISKAAEEDKSIRATADDALAKINKSK